MQNPTPAKDDSKQADSWNAVPVKEKPAKEEPDNRPIAELIQEVKEAAAEDNAEGACIQSSTWYVSIKNVYLLISEGAVVGFCLDRNIA